MQAPAVAIAAAMFVLVMLVAPDAEAQTPKKIPRVGVLSASDARPIQREPFERALQELGWRPGSTVLIDYRETTRQQDRLTDDAAELVRLKVDVIVTRGSPATRVAQQVTRTIPIVMAPVADPIGYSMFGKLFRPQSENLTGVVLLRTDLGPKALELLTAAVPGVRRIAVLWDTGRHSHPARVKALEEAARSLGAQVLSVGTRPGADLKTAFADMERRNAEALLIVGSSDFLKERHRLVELTLEHRLPAMFDASEQVEAGGLMSYSPDYADLLRQSAVYVDKLLRGAKPNDLPVKQYSKFQLVINLKTAKALGLTIPSSLLLRADQVVE